MSTGGKGKSHELLGKVSLNPAMPIQLNPYPGFISKSGPDPGLLTKN
jgi:hypothetical protein